MKFYLDESSFTGFVGLVPENWYNICSAANEEIDRYIAENELDPDTDSEQIRDWADLHIWEDWFTHGLMPEDLKQGMLSDSTFAAAVALMDDEIREAIHAEGECTSNYEFLEEYNRRHYLKYDEYFQF